MAFKRGKEIRRLGMLVGVGPLVLAEVAARLHDQPPGIHQPAALARFGLGQTFADHRRDDQVADTASRLARAQKQQSLRSERAARHAQCGVKPRQRDARRALNVIVEAAHPIAILVQHAERVQIREVLELDDGAGKYLLRRGHELFHQGVVLGAAQPRLLEADVERILQEGRIVGADVEHHRKSGRGMNSGAGRIERELAHRDAHAVGAQVAEPEDALAVGDDHDLHVARWPVAQHCGDTAAVGGRDPNAARSLEDVREALAREPHRGGVDQRHHFVRVIHHHAEEQGLVAVVQRVEVDELVEIGWLRAQAVEYPRHLLLGRDHGGRQQAAQAQCVALMVR